MNKVVFIILYVLLTISNVNADSVRIDDVELAGLSIGKYCEYLEDVNQEWTIEEVSSVSFDNKFVVSKTKNMNFGFLRKSAYWIRFSLSNQSSQSKRILFEINNPHLEKYEIYKVNDEVELLDKGGAIYPFDTREFPFRTFVSFISVDPGKSVYYMRVDRRGLLVVSPRVWDESEFRKYAVNSNMFYGILFGILIIMFVYNFFIYITTRDIPYLMLSNLIIAYLLVFLAMDGIGVQYIFTQSTHFMSLFNLFILLYFIFTIIFVRAYLKSSEYTPLIDSILKSVLFLLCIFASFYFLLPFTIFITLSYFILYLLPLFHVLAITSAIISFKRGYRTSIFYIIAVVSGMIIMTLAIFEAMNVIPYSLLSIYGPKISVIIFLSFMSLGLADQINEYKKRLEQSNKELQLKEENYREIFNASNESIFILDANNGSILDVNNTVVEMYGHEYEDALTLSINDFSIGESPYSQKEVIIMVNKVVNEGPQLFEWLAKRKNGELFWVEVSLSTTEIGGAGRIMAVVRDITERKRTHEIMIQTEKMMSVGGLAAGMAHEINNPLSSIIQGVQNVRRRISSVNKKNQEIAELHQLDLNKLDSYFKERGIYDFLSGIYEAGIRAAEIVKNMLNFSRQSDAIHKEENMNQVLDEIIELASHEYDLKKKYDFKKISVVREYMKDLPSVKFVKSEIQQVILNLLKNGAEMMLEKSQSEQCQLEGYQPTFYVRTYQRNDSIFIEVEDNGPGIDAAIRKRVFEPFYTTKPVGKGTGLGLSVSYFIITQNHNGNMWVESDEGKGAKFVIELPV